MIARLTLTVVAAMVWSGVAAAGIVNTTGDAQVVGPPLSVVPPDYQENGTIHVFAEQAGVTLPADVQADMTVHYTVYNPPGEGPWDPSTTGRTLGMIPMGTVVNSYYLHFDPATFGGVIGSVTFAEPILGVIAEGDETAGTAVNDPPGDTLGPTNYLGDLTIPTAYPDNDENLGIEDGPDRVTLYESTLKVAFGAGSPGDRIRVLTDPGGTVLCGNGILDPGEGCDDGNLTAGDGCFGCQLEICATCTGEPSSCSPITMCTGGDGCCAPGCTPATDTDCRVSCTVKKIRSTDAKKNCMLGCFAKAASRGTPVNSACTDRCTAKFDFGFFKAELNGGCQTTDDGPAIEAKVDAFLADVVTALDPAPPDDQNRCRAKKFKCVAKYDHCVLSLYFRAAKTGVIDPIKKSVCAAKFDACFTKAETAGDCEIFSDAAAIQATDDAFITDATCELQVCP